MKKLILAGLIACGTWGVVVAVPATVEATDCSTVRCAECPAGTVWSPKPNDCCRCVPE